MLINLALSSICAGVQTFVAFILDEKPEWTKWEMITMKNVLMAQMCSHKQHLATNQQISFNYDCQTSSTDRCGFLFLLLPSRASHVLWWRNPFVQGNHKMLELWEGIALMMMVMMTWWWWWWWHGDDDDDCLLLIIGDNWLLSGFRQQMQLITSFALFDRGAVHIW